MYYQIIDCYFNVFFVEIQLKKTLGTRTPEFGHPNWYTSLLNNLNTSLTETQSFAKLFAKAVSLVI